MYAFSKCPAGRKGIGPFYALKQEGTYGFQIATFWSRAVTRGGTPFFGPNCGHVINGQPLNQKRFLYTKFSNFVVTINKQKTLLPEGHRAFSHPVQDVSSLLDGSKISLIKQCHLPFRQKKKLRPLFSVFFYSDILTLDHLRPWRALPYPCFFSQGLFMALHTLFWISE